MLEKNEQRRRLLESKRSLICRGAMKVLKKKKFHAASMGEIAEATGMSRGNFYHYIEKKEDILVLIYKELANQIWRRMHAVLQEYEHPIDQLSYVIRTLFDLACREKEEVLVILTEAKSLDRKHLQELLRHESEIVDAIEEIIKRGISRGFFQCAKPHLLADMIAYLIWIVPLRGWNILQRHSEKDVVDQTIACCLRELGVSKKAISKSSMNMQRSGGNSNNMKKKGGNKNDSNSARFIETKQRNVSGQSRPD